MSHNDAVYIEELSVLHDYLLCNGPFGAVYAIVAIVAILVAGFVIYYAFVFRRIVVIRAKLSQREKQIEIEARTFL